MNLIRIHPLDNVAVALEDIPTGETVTAGGSTVTARQAIPRGHKLALAAVPAGARIIKYGCTIGLAKADIAPGDWVHVHNVRTGLSEDGVYAHHPRVGALPPSLPGLSRATAAPTAGPPSAMSCGSSPLWAASTPSPRPWYGKTSI